MEEDISNYSPTVMFRGHPVRFSKPINIFSQDLFGANVVQIFTFFQILLNNFLCGTLSDAKLIKLHQLRSLAILVWETFNFVDCLWGCQRWKVFGPIFVYRASLVQSSFPGWYSKRSCSVTTELNNLRENTNYTELNVWRIKSIGRTQPGWIQWALKKLKGWEV